MLPGDAWWHAQERDTLFAYMTQGIDPDTIAQSYPIAQNEKAQLFLVYIGPNSTNDSISLAIFGTAGCILSVGQVDHVDIGTLEPGWRLIQVPLTSSMNCHIITEALKQPPFGQLPDGNQNAITDSLIIDQ